ncbi:SpoIIE family protein phosphatase [bacterium]|nr:SpoIIE family protein phosphatase [bacterium]
MFADWNLKWKLFSIISVTLLLAVLFFSFLINTYEKQLLLKIHHEKGRGLSQIILQNLKVMMISGNKLQILDFLNSKVSDEVQDISLIKLDEEKVLYSTARDIEGTDISASDVEFLSDIKAEFIKSPSHNGGAIKAYYVYVGNAFFRDSGTFVLRIDYSQQVIYDFIRKQTNQIMFVSIVILLLGFAISFITGSLLTRPVNSLMEGIVELGKGNLDFKINLSTKDEFGRLAGAFNRMSENLQFAQKQIIVKELMERDFKMAQEIQNALFIKEVPASEILDITPFYEAARMIGGDYYDIMTRDDKKTVLVADVSGKGIPGSLIMVMLRSLIRAQYYGEDNLRELIMKVNHLLMQDIQPGKFVTLLIADFHEKTETVSIINAGHIPLYKYIAKEDRVEELVPSGLGLGLNDGVIFDQNLDLGEDKMAPGDIYLFCTDGATEAMNPNKDQFGEERLANALKQYKDQGSKEIVENIRKDIKSFLAGEEFNDDFTLVVVKRNNKEV